MRSRRGFMLIEMFLTLTLCSLFLLISARLFVATFTTLHEAPLQANQILQLEQIRKRLGSDMWSAVNIRCPDDSSLLLLDATGVLTTWQRLDDGSIRRTRLDEQARWTDALPVNFDAAGATIRISHKDRAWSFTSQVLIAGRTP